MKQKKAVLVVTTFLLLGCRDVRDTELSKLTNTQRTSLDKKLNGEEERLLIDYMKRQEMSPAFGGRGAPDGITARQAINEQRNFLQKEEQAKAEDAKKWIDAGRKSKQWEFAQLLSESFVDKWTHDEDFGEKYVAMEMAFENKTDKDIKGVKGTVKITDILGNAIKNVSFSFDRGIAPKSTVKYIHYIRINQVADKDLLLWNTDFDKLKASFEIATIIYRDGTKVETPDASQLERPRILWASNGETPLRRHGRFPRLPGYGES